MITITDIDKKLADLKTGEAGIITKVRGHGAFRKRITEMGFVKGKAVRVIRNAPLLDPVEYEIMGYQVSLRRSEANLIEVVSPDQIEAFAGAPFNGTIDIEGLKTTAGEKGNTIQVALVGNPNCGKTTLYNYASGSSERVGNYGGVTVDAREARFKQQGYTFQIVDLPGTYSITEYTPEELYVRTHLHEEKPDVVVNVVDASNIERNLFLTTQLIDMNIKVVIALNMADELEKTGARLDTEAFGKLTGIPVIPTIASKGKGIKALFSKVIDVYEEREPIVRHIHIHYGTNIEAAIKTIQPLIRQNPEITDSYSSRFLSIKLLENDKHTLKILENCRNYQQIIEISTHQINLLEKEYGEKSGTIIADAKYGFIAGALGETFQEGPEQKRKATAGIDAILTHRLLGFPIFFLFMWIMFQATFSLGSIPMDWIDAGIGLIGDGVHTLMPEGMLRDLLVDGIIGGVGGVIIFLPNILILFFFISFMEDTGYMARASFIMDRLMHKIGLHGKSFIPMLMGFGCNVPAIMATRTLESRKDRILTMMVIPFMSCSARLPVYVLFISAFFMHNQGLVLISIYTIGVLLAVAVALVLKKVMFAKEDIPFVMELPPYRIPTLRNTAKHMWHKGVQYLHKMGTVILVASVIIWALGYFPRHKTMEESYIGRIGHAIEPAIRPLGFDWKIGISLITGMAAKEIVVGSMGVLYQSEDEQDNTQGLQNKLHQQVHTHGDLKGQKVFTPLTAYALMLFILVYFPCIAVIAAIRKEANWKWALFTMVYTTGLAWLIAFVVYRAGMLFS